MLGRSSRGILVVSSLTLLAAGFLPVGAHEPDGVVRFQTEGVVAAPDGAEGFLPGEKLVRVVITVTRDLADAVLTHKSPSGVLQRLVTAKTVSSPLKVIDPTEAPSPGRLELGKLTAGTPITLEFAEGFAEGTGGIVTFTVVGFQADGKITSESFGQVVGTPEPPGVLYEGAIQYPAHELPPEVKP